MYSKHITRVLFFFYFVALFYVVFIGGNRHLFVSLKDRINIVPLKSLIRFYHTNPHQGRFYFVFFTEIAGNVILFIPFGFLFKCIYPKTLSQTIVLYGLLLSVGIELTQLFLQIGICDIDDVILNTTGSAAGVFLCTKMIRSTQAIRLVRR